MNKLKYLILFGFLLIQLTGANAQTQIPNTNIYTNGDKTGVNNPIPNANLDVKGKAKFRGLNGGKGSIDESLAAVLVGTGQTRAGVIGAYFPGIGFNHLLTYSNSTTVGWDNQMHAWIGTRLIATPASELSALVFATTTNTGSTGTQFPTEKMVIMPTGEVGINTKSPTGSLHLKMHNNSTAHAFTLESYNGSSRWNILPEASTNAGYGDRSLLFHSSIAGYVMSLNGNGNVGIGLNNPKNKLEVNGTIRSKEIKVDANGWADFVFKSDYSLMSLSELETFINLKGHLPNIPTKKEVEEKGISVGEMNAKLLQKIEELTLYVIELKKENQEIKNLLNNK